MTIDVYEPTERERRVAEALRQRAVQEIDRRRDLNQVGRLLGLRLQAVEALLRAPSWDLATAFRVAEALSVTAVDDLERVLQHSAVDVRKAS